MSLNVQMLQGRADRPNRMARIIMRTVALLNVGEGLAWTVGDPNRTLVPVYVPARRLIAHLGLPVDPARIWGAVLLLIALGVLAAMEWRHELVTRIFCAAGVLYWLFWIVLDAVAATADRGSLTAPFTAAVVAVGFLRGAVGSQLLTRRAVVPEG